MSSSRSSSRDSFKSIDSTPNVQRDVHAPPDPEARIAAPPASDNTDTEPINERLPKEEELKLKEESANAKAAGNGQFAAQAFSSAVQTYDRALALLPSYLDYEIAVLGSNIAACHLKLQEWREAIDSATKAADRLERLDPAPKPPSGQAKAKPGEPKSSNEVVEAVQEVDDDTDAAISRINDSGHTLDEVQRLRIKVLMRRAAARKMVGTWVELQGAQEDYQRVQGMHQLSNLDKATVDRELRTIKPRLETAQKQEMEEMVGKLKDLGNGILKPFGLSTDMFNFVKDEKTGGYSMNFGQNK